MFRFIALALCIITGGAVAAEAPSALSYEQYIKEMQSALPELDSNEIAVLSAQNDVTSSKAAGNVALSAGGSMTSTKTYIDPGNGSGNVADKSLNVGASKKIVSTGTTVETSASYAQDRYSSFPSAADSSTYKPAVTVKVTQPLLNNFLGKVDRFTERDAKAKLDVAKIQLSETNKSTLNAYKKIYFQWEAYRRILKSSEESIVNAQMLSSQVERNYRVGLAEDYTYQQTVSSLLAYKGTKQTNEISLTTVQKQLGVYINTDKYLPSASDFEKHLSAALDEKYDTVSFASTESAKILNLTLQRYTDAADVYANELLPSLDVYGQVSRKNRSDSAAVSSLPDTDYGIGFSFTYKLGNDAANASLEAAKIQKKQILLEIRSTENSFKKTLLQYQESANGTKSLIRNKEEMIKALSAQLSSQRKRYGQGRLGITDVITTENSIDSAKIELITLQYNLIAAYIDYRDLVK